MILNFTSDFPPNSTPALPGNGKGPDIEEDSSTKKAIPSTQI